MRRIRKYGMMAPGGTTYPGGRGSAQMPSLGGRYRTPMMGLGGASSIRALGSIHNATTMSIGGHSGTKPTGEGATVKTMPNLAPKAPMKSNMPNYLRPKPRRVPPISRPAQKAVPGVGPTLIASLLGDTMQYATIPAEWRVQSHDPVKAVLETKESQTAKIAALKNMKQLKGAVKGTNFQRAKKLGMQQQAGDALKELKLKKYANAFTPAAHAIGRGIDRLWKPAKVLGGGYLAVKGAQQVKKASSTNYGLGSWAMLKGKQAGSRLGKEATFQKKTLTRRTLVNTGQGALAMLGMYVMARILNKIPEVSSDIEHSPQYAKFNAREYATHITQYVHHLEDKELYAAESFGQRLYKGSRNSSLAWLLGFISAELLGRGMSRMPQISRQEVIQQNALQEDIVNYVLGMNIGKVGKPTTGFNASKVRSKYPGAAVFRGAHKQVLKRRPLWRKAASAVGKVGSKIGKVASPVMSGLIGASIISDLLPKKRPPQSQQVQYASLKPAGKVIKRLRKLKSGRYRPLGVESKKIATIRGRAPKGVIYGPDFTPSTGQVYSSQYAYGKETIQRALAWLKKHHQSRKLRNLKKMQGKVSRSPRRQSQIHDPFFHGVPSRRNVKDDLLNAALRQMGKKESAQKLAAIGIPAAAIIGAAGTYPVVKGQVKKKVIKAVEDYGMQKYSLKSKAYNEALDMWIKAQAKLKRAKYVTAATGAGAAATGYLVGSKRTQRKLMKPKEGTQYSNVAKPKKSILRRVVTGAALAGAGYGGYRAAKGILAHRALSKKIHASVQSKFGGVNYAIVGPLLAAAKGLIKPALAGTRAIGGAAASGVGRLTGSRHLLRAGKGLTTKAATGFGTTRKATRTIGRVGLSGVTAGHMIGKRRSRYSLLKQGKLNYFKIPSVPRSLKIGLGVAGAATAAGVIAKLISKLPSADEREAREIVKEIEHWKKVKSNLKAKGAYSPQVLKQAQQRAETNRIMQEKENAKEWRHMRESLYTD